MGPWQTTPLGQSDILCCDWTVPEWAARPFWTKASREGAQRAAELRGHQEERAFSTSPSPPGTVSEARSWSSWHRVCSLPGCSVYARLSHMWQAATSSQGETRTRRDPYAFSLGFRHLRLFKLPDELRMHWISTGMDELRPQEAWPREARQSWHCLILLMLPHHYLATSVVFFFNRSSARQNQGPPLSLPISYFLAILRAINARTTLAYFGEISQLTIIRIKPRVVLLRSRVV